MSTSLIPDPMQLWRDALKRLENDVNAAASGSLRSQEVVRALHQLTTASQGVQQLFEKAVEAYLRRANLPSRKEVAELADALKRIEDKLDRIVPAEGPAAGLRPARTRRPPGAAVATQGGPAPAAAPAPAASAPAARPAKARKAPRRAAAPAAPRARGRP